MVEEKGQENKKKENQCHYTFHILKIKLKIVLKNDQELSKRMDKLVSEIKIFVVISIRNPTFTTATKQLTMVSSVFYLFLLHFMATKSKGLQ